MDDKDDVILGKLLYGPAFMLPGSQLNDEQLLRATTDTFPGRAFCIVKRWMLIDVRLTGRHLALLSEEELQPTVLYANAVTYSSAGVRKGPYGVLSSFQRYFQDCFFETEDMVYVLAGRGARKEADMDAVFALATKCGAEFLRNP